MDKVVPEIPVPPLEKSEKRLFAKIKKFFTNFRSLPVGTKKLLSLGLVAALLIALPIIVMTIVTSRTFFFNRAATGETVEPPHPTYSPSPKPTIDPFSCNKQCQLPNIGCPTGLTCYQPPMPECRPGTACLQVMPSPVCRNPQCLESSSCLCPTPTLNPVPRSPTPTPRSPIPAPVHTTTPIPWYPSPTPEFTSPTPIAIGTPISVLPPVISTRSIPTGRVNKYYSATISGYENTSYTNLSMNISGLPKGLSKTCTTDTSINGDMTTINCHIKGTPSAWGFFRVPVMLSDGYGQSVFKAFTLIIYPF